MKRRFSRDAFIHSGAEVVHLSRWWAVGVIQLRDVQVFAAEEKKAPTPRKAG